MTRSFWWLTVDALAVFRLTMLVVNDSITEPYREWVRRRGWTQDPGRPELPIPIPTRQGKWSRSLHTLVGCPWCISVHLAVLVVVLTALVPTAWQYGAMALALSGVAGFLATVR